MTLHLRVAAVDDDPLWLSVLGRALARESMFASLIGDASRAVDEIISGDTQLVLLDYGLPGTNGARIARELRERLGTDCPPIVLVTGDLLGVPAEDRACFDAELEKPFALDALLSTIRLVMRKRRVSGMRKAATTGEDSGASGTG